jgi:hypothetical protein
MWSQITLEGIGELVDAPHILSVLAFIHPADAGEPHVAKLFAYHPSSSRSVLCGAAGCAAFTSCASVPWRTTYPSRNNLNNIE